jgi:hypothetical protein
VEGVRRGRKEGAKSCCSEDFKNRRDFTEENFHALKLLGEPSGAV